VDNQVRPVRNFVKELIITLVVAIVIFLLLRLVVGSYAVISDSMEPGLYEGERILVNKMAYHFGEPQRGEIVVFASPEDESPLIKRIIGLPGDIIEIKNNVVLVNRSRLIEPYLKESPNYNMSSLQVPAQHYFVLGDNRNNSHDSHSGWTVPQENIVGRAWIFTWPPGKWGTIPSYPLTLESAASTSP
jgi:signal peptidase I